MSEKFCDLSCKNDRCIAIDSYENLPPSKRTKMVIDIFKSIWGKWTLRIVVISLSIIFLMSVAEIFLQDKEIAKTLKLDLKVFTSLQVWVSFILGLVATLFSIISMFLSFYNLEQQQEAEKSIEKANKQLKENIVLEINSVLEGIKKDLIDEVSKNSKSELENIKLEIIETTKEELSNIVDSIEKSNKKMIDNVVNKSIDEELDDYKSSDEFDEFDF